MPCYNAEAFVREAVDSVLAQRHPDTELVVVDDGSSDGSRALLSAYGPAIRLIEQDHGGAYRARNAGLAAATGEFVAFLDADDYWHPDCLAKLHGALVAAGADLAYCGWQNVGSGARGREPYVPPDYSAGDAVAAFLASCPWPIHAALIRRAAVQGVGGFAERLVTAEDYDLWLRLLAHGARIVRVAEVLAFYRWHGTGQLSAVRWRQVRDARRVKRSFVAAHPALVRHLGRRRLRELIDGPVREAAYDAYWRRDLASARKLFRELLWAGGVRPRDLKYLLASQVPRPLLQPLLRLADRLRAGARGV
jgi:glycosyltransferase involved in cell wall biosynthesis